jgi:addiction module HigA family antidote
MRKPVARTPLHPGEILREQFMTDFGVSMNRLARDLRVPPTRISEIVNERRAITPDTALRLARYFGTTAEFWMNLQSAYDLDIARASISQIEADVRPIAAA